MFNSTRNHNLSSNCVQLYHIFFATSVMQRFFSFTRIHSLMLKDFNGFPAFHSLLYFLTGSLLASPNEARFSQLVGFGRRRCVRCASR